MSAIKALKHQVGTNTSQYLNLCIQTDNSGNLIFTKGNWDTVPQLDVAILYNNHSGFGIKQTATNQIASLSFLNEAGVTQGMYGFDHATKRAVIATGTDTLVNRLFIDSTGLTPASDNSFPLGGSANRWSTVYAGTGTINTSDEREKQDIAPIDEAVLKAWAKVQFAQFKFVDAVEAKGDNARVHFGVVAQQVKEAFESEGLDPFAYGVLCYDKWETYHEEPELDEEGNETGEMKTVVMVHDRYGIRYEEALALECAYLRSRLNNLDQ